MTASVLSVVGPVDPFGPLMFTKAMPAPVVVKSLLSARPKFSVSLKLGLLGRNTSKNPIKSLPLAPLFTLLICKELEELVLVTTKFESVPLPREIVSVVPVIAMSRVFALVRSP